MRTQRDYVYRTNAYFECLCRLDAMLVEYANVGAIKNADEHACKHIYVYMYIYIYICIYIYIQTQT